MATGVTARWSHKLQIRKTNVYSKKPQPFTFIAKYDIVLIMINFLLNRNIKSTVVVYLAVAVLGISVFGLGLVHHESFMEESHTLLTCKSIDCGVPVNDISCLDHCISAVQNFIQTAPIVPGVKLSVLLALALFLGLFFALAPNLLNAQKFSKIRLRQLYEESVTAFFDQLGFWLTLFEKRDPSYAFVPA